MTTGSKAMMTMSCGLLLFYIFSTCSYLCECLESITLVPPFSSHARITAHFLVNPNRPRCVNLKFSAQALLSFIGRLLFFNFSLSFSLSQQKKNPGLSSIRLLRLHQYLFCVKTHHAASVHFSCLCRDEKQLTKENLERPLKQGTQPSRIRTGDFSYSRSIFTETHKGLADHFRRLSHSPLPIGAGFVSFFLVLSAL
jgi:hypothetical protein